MPQDPDHVVRPEGVEKDLDKLDIQLFTMQQAAQILGVSKPTLKTYLRRGDIVAVRLSNRLRIRKADLEEFVNSRRFRYTKAEPNV